MHLDDHIGFLALALLDLMAILTVGTALVWAAVRDGRDDLLARLGR